MLWSLVEKNIVILNRQQRRHVPVGKLKVTPGELSAPFQTALTELVRASQAAADVVAVATFSVKMRREQPSADQARFAGISLYYMPHMTLEGLFAAFDEYNRVIRHVARKTGALLIDDESGIPGDDAHFTDSIHFADAGSQRMAERIARQLRISPALLAMVPDERAAAGAASQAMRGAEE